jgi:hypothetical protein
VTGTRARRQKQLLDILKETTRYCKLKEDTLDRTLKKKKKKLAVSEAMDVIRQTTELMNAVIATHR